MKIFTKKTFKKLIFSIPILLVVIIFLTNYYIEYYSSQYIYEDIDDLPKNNVGLLLGTSKYLTNGRDNLYYKYRIEAAVKLFKNNKIEYIIVSGDNSTIQYNEPLNMQKDLIERGVDKNKIYLDYAGLRTLDSVIRSKEVFGQSKITIISQKFHNERAVFIAKHKNIDAIGYNAKDVNYQYGFKTNIREYFARVKMILDIIINKQPKFLGEKIAITKIN